MRDFIMAALPWVCMGLAVLLIVWRHNSRKNSLATGKNQKLSAASADGSDAAVPPACDLTDGETGKTSEKSDEADEDGSYMTEGMCIGMCLGVAVGTAINQIGVGISVGMLLGLCIGVSMKKK